MFFFVDTSSVLIGWFILGLISAVICGILASGKNRPAALWGFIGFIAPVIGIIVIAALPREEARWERDRNRKESEAIRGVARDRMRSARPPGQAPRSAPRRHVRRG